MYVLICLVIRHLIIQCIVYRSGAKHLLTPGCMVTCVIYLDSIPQTPANRCNMQPHPVDGTEPPNHIKPLRESIVDPSCCL